MAARNLESSLPSARASRVSSPQITSHERSLSSVSFALTAWLHANLELGKAGSQMEMRNIVTLVPDTPGKIRQLETTLPASGIRG